MIAAPTFDCDQCDHDFVRRDGEDVVRRGVDRVEHHHDDDGVDRDDLHEAAS